MKYEKIMCFALAAYIGIALIFEVKGSVQHHVSGRLHSKLGVELSDAADANRQLRETIGECRGIVTELRATTERSITSAGEAVEVLEELRVQVQELEECLYGDGAGYDYSYWDSYLGIE